MSKIIYFTNALDQNSFKEYLKNWSVSPNLSNQNFHNKLIKALSLSFDVEVISIRAINSNYKESKLPKQTFAELNVTWKYPKVTTSKVGKVLFLSKRIKEVLSFDKESIIFVDALNYSLLKEAYKIGKKRHCKVIGVCTDNPNNISFTSSFYKKSLLKYAYKLDGYIVLTEGINKVYNKGNKPYLQIDGVSDDLLVKSKSLIDGPYIYFGGSLMEEYGVYSLIEAFKELDLKNTRLVICGHHLQKEKLDKAIENCPSILYLGPVNYEDNLSLERNAVLSVNPRPINPIIDDYSIPSKTLESLAMKCLNVTVNNKLLMQHYNDVIVWAKSSDKEDLKDAISKALSLSKEKRTEIIESGYKKVMLRTSQSNISKNIKDFLLKFFLN